MTVDKPPLALWVQAPSVKLFGFHSLSILVPQALMGVAAVGARLRLSRRRFGRGAGGAAGRRSRTTPITVAISRHNNPDALLVRCCSAALWFRVRGLEDGRTRWLVLRRSSGSASRRRWPSALMVVPGIAAAWLWVAPGGRRRGALRQLLAGGAAMVAVGGAWPLLLALTPASHRPWVSGTSNNSIWSLILGYNGLGRLNGQAGGPGAAVAAVRRPGGRAAAAVGGPARVPAARLARSAARPAGCSGFALVVRRGHPRGEAACAAPTPAPAG